MKHEISCGDLVREICGIFPDMSDGQFNAVWRACDEFHCELELDISNKRLIELLREIK